MACPDGAAIRCARAGIDAGGEIAQDLPLGARLADRRAGDVGAEGDAPLGGGLGAPVALLVTGGGGQEHHHLAWIDEHLGGDDDVLVHPHRGPREHGGDVLRVGQGVEEVAAARVEDLEPAVAGGLDHLRRRQAGGGRHVEAPELRQGGGGGGVEGHAPRQRRGVRAHLGPALHPRVAADGHEARALAADIAPGEREVDHRAHVLRAEGVLGEPHRPDQDRRAGRRVHRREALHVGAARARQHLQVAEGQILERLGQLREAGRVLGDERLVEAAGGGQRLHHARDEGDVAADVHGEELVGHLRAEDGALGVGGHPVALEAGLAVRVDDRHLRAALARQEEVLHDDRLRVRHVGAEEHDQVARHQVGVRDRRRAGADHRLHCPGMAVSRGFVWFQRHHFIHARQAPRNLGISGGRQL